jgi:ABC-2 type transport system ATP-binding protein
MVRRCAQLVATATAVALLGLPAGAAQARDVVVTSFDGTRIVAHFYDAAVPGPAPTVLVGPGYGKAGNNSPTLDLSDIIGTATLRQHGYNVLTWDPRGFGGSSGSVTFDSPAAEARDVSALIDYVAAQPDAVLDAPGDPRIGMSGFSYGGAIQLVSAAIDPRIDAIVPEGAWHSLLTSLFKDGAVKLGWVAEICAEGEVFALTGGLLPSPIGLQLGDTAGALRLACLEALTTGRLSAASRSWLAARGPAGLLGEIRAPTLILQGTDDALFPLSEAVANYDALRSAGRQVRMIWYCGGHGPCETPNPNPRHAADAGLAWLDRLLKGGAGADTGAPFEWLADDGVWRSGPDYPLASIGTLDASASRRLILSPVDSVGSGFVLYSTPATVNAANVTFPAAAAPSDVVGEPVARLTYRGTAVPARTFLYAQVLDNGRGRVVGAVSTPIPVVLDGRWHTVTRPLEPVALRDGPGSDYRLQIVAGGLFYGPQRSAGSVSMNVDASLPVVDATRSGRPGAGAAPLATPLRPRIAVTSTRARRGTRAVRLTLRSRLRSRPCGGTMTFAVRLGAKTPTYHAAISTTTCRAVKHVTLRARRGRHVRVSMRFDGNGALAARRARSVSYRLR